MLVSSSLNGVPIPELDTPSKPTILSKKPDAVTIPVKVASPCCLIVTPIPDPTPISKPVGAAKNHQDGFCSGSVPIPAEFLTLVNDILYLSCTIYNIIDTIRFGYKYTNTYC